MTDEPETTEAPEPVAPLPALTEAELEQLAIDIVTNVMYVPMTPEAMECSFGMMMMFGAGKFPPNVGMLYEEWSKAGERSVNGYPTFFSLKMVAEESVEPLWERVRAKARALGLLPSDEAEAPNPQP